MNDLYCEQKSFWRRQQARLPRRQNQ